MGPIRLYVESAAVVLVVVAVLYIGCYLIVRIASEITSKSREEQYRRGYNAGYYKGHTTGVKEGREEAIKTAKIVDVNAKTTVNEIRKAYGFSPSEYLDNLRDFGMINQSEYESAKGSAIARAWEMRNGQE